MFGLEYLLDALSPLNLGLALMGVVAGTVVGALPGLTATMAVAILVPITFTMSPVAALIVMGAVYTGAIYGGAYSAILLNTPGTPSAIATTFDGYPMARRGDGNLAISLACIASVVGGIIGSMALLTISPYLAGVAMAFGPAEYFWLAVLGLTLIAALSKGNLLKGIIAGCFGLLLSTIGVAEISADVRFTFGIPALLGGIAIIPALIGLYCIPVLIDLIATPEKHLNVSRDSSGFRFWEAVGKSLKKPLNVIRSSILGTVVGILPGAGGSIASLVAYAEARRTSKSPETFGKGNPEGIVATESANNATVGGGLVPTFVLGIPGTPPDAIILGALMIQGMKPGPSLYTDQPAVVYTFVWGLLLATLLMLPTGLVVGRYAYRAIISVPKAFLVPAVAVMTMIGTYAVRNSVSDMLVMLVLGVIGWVFNRYGYSQSSIVLGLILGRIAEQGFVQTWIIGTAKGNPVAELVSRPISMGIIAFIVISFALPVIKKRIRINREISYANGQE
ncbi:MAG: tripartite tricarboxylate transporter permease [Candidatus Thiodiazotropha sp.]